MVPTTSARWTVDTETGCWLWSGTILRSGYGSAGHQKLAHRVVYEEFVGPVPVGKQLDHLCRTRHCVRPSHLEPVTRKENILRGEGITAQQARRKRCVHGHLLSGDNVRIYSGKRKCMTCTKAQQRRWYAARKAVVAHGEQQRLGDTRHA